MGAQGTEFIDFGSVPAESASATVFTAGILSNSLVEAFFMRIDTVDNGVDEHEEAAIMCPLVCGDIVAGTSFVVTAHPISAYGLGQFLFCWVWN